MSDAATPAEMTADPEEALAAVWAGLAAAIAVRGAPERTPVLATVGLGGAPEARMVVLRRLAPDRGAVEIHTDRRSAKAAALARRAEAALVIWRPQLELQVRLTGAARVETEGAPVDAAWAALAEGQQRAYASRPEPGAVVDAADAHARGLAAEGRAAFALVTLTARRLDLLWLRASGHRRRRLDLADGRLVGAAWLAP